MGALTQELQPPLRRQDCRRAIGLSQPFTTFDSFRMQEGRKSYFALDKVPVQCTESCCRAGGNSDVFPGRSRCLQSTAQRCDLQGRSSIGTARQTWGTPWNVHDHIPSEGLKWRNLWKNPSLNGWKVTADSRGSKN